MKRSLLFSTLGGALLLMSQAAAAGPNLVFNPGFETGDFDGWTATGNLGSDIGVDGYPEDVNSGSYGAFLGNSATSSLSQGIATAAGASYAVSFYLDVYQSTAYDGFFTATFGGATVVNLTEPAETDYFVRYDATLDATSTTSDLVFSASDPGGYFGLDDISVTQLTSAVPEPGTGPLILAAIGLLALMARRRGRRPSHGVGVAAAGAHA